MFYSSFGPAFASLSLVLSASALSTELNIVNAEISPDGFTRQGVLANGTFPGPIIKGNKASNSLPMFGDNFQINVNNQLTNVTMETSTTVHWHGIKQRHSNWADGPAFVTQCPIAADDSFLYHFDVPDQAGLQYCDGLRGPLIVYDPDDPHKDLYDVDDDTTVITLADWYHLPANELPVPTYRFRLISTSCHPYFNFTIDGHDNFTIIEADGENTEPLPGIDQIQIHAAQRYSFVLEANQPNGSYWIRATPEKIVNGTPTGLAILRYRGAADEDPSGNTTVTPQPKNPLLEPNLRVYGNVSNPTVPVLLQILNGTYNAHDLMPNNSVQYLPRNQTIQVTMHGLRAGPHPIHLHGHSFFVIQSAGSNGTNYVNPVLRDTVSIGTNTTDKVIIRFTTDNPGPWLMHCHIDFHLAAGFALVMAEAPDDVPGFVAPIPPAWNELCPKYESTHPGKLVA
ncbi:Cupredoxin [Fomitopsis serialis]|uniref:Cupredoxin n=1 Tax=Fomitopsis serialis TaxID=139415 RepID=UPI002007DB4A|nr:Cupredoxin [Neoantrodia serialis]KAH9926904.1 Cupredoxin [Neoantrodia serialis]